MPKPRKQLVSLESTPTNTAFHVVFDELFYVVQIRMAVPLSTVVAGLKI